MMMLIWSNFCTHFQMENTHFLQFGDLHGIYTPRIKIQDYMKLRLIMSNTFHNIHETFSRYSALDYDYYNIT